MWKRIIMHSQRSNTNQVWKKSVVRRFRDFGNLFEVQIMTGYEIISKFVINESQFF